MDDDSVQIDRRSALRATAGLVAAGTAGLAGCSGSGGGGGSEPADNTVLVGPENKLVFEPAELTVTVGEEVTWVWKSDTHNIVPSSQPDGANWGGTEGGADTLYDTGHEYSYTFETAGTYEYYCAPHRSAGMTGTVVVESE